MLNIFAVNHLNPFRKYLTRMKIIVIKKNTSITELDWKDVDLEKIYKKAGFRKDTDFDKRNTWKIKDGDFVSVYSKNAGRAKTENKYELPPPIASDLYFGKLVIIRHSEQKPTSENCKDITISEWQKIYDTLMGGAEEIDDDEEESEEEYVDPEDLTKQGYKKDGFVVDDSVIDTNTEESEEGEWISSENEDDSLEGTDGEVDQEQETKGQNVGSDEESEEESEEESDASMISDDELHEEDYEY